MTIIKYYELYLKDQIICLNNHNKILRIIGFVTLNDFFGHFLLRTLTGRKVPLKDKQWDQNIDKRQTLSNSKTRVI